MIIMITIITKMKAVLLPAHLFMRLVNIRWKVQLPSRRQATVGIVHRPLIGVHPIHFMMILLKRRNFNIIIIIIITFQILIIRAPFHCHHYQRGLGHHHLLQTNNNHNILRPGIWRWAALVTIYSHQHQLLLRIMASPILLNHMYGLLY